jgi:hypothetical protein
MLYAIKNDEKHVPCIGKEKQKDVETLVVSDREKEDTPSARSFQKLSLAFHARMKGEAATTTSSFAK